jgi:DNA polymerase (family 10)
VSKNSVRIHRTVADGIINLLRQAGGQFTVAGSYRRGYPEVGDLDVVVLESDLPKMQALAQTLGTPVTLKDGKIVGMVIAGTRVEFYVTTPAQFGAMLLFATGSAEFNIWQRSQAKAKGLKLSQLGLFDGSGHVLAGETEEGMFAALDMAYVPPEKRDAKYQYRR